MVVSRIANTLWLHKKKSIFTVVVGAYGVTALRSRLRDDQTRHNFAERAQRYGLMRIEPTQRLRRVTVLINREAGGRRAADLFKRNALPLLNLAGLQVNVLELVKKNFYVSSASEMESLCRVLDASEADCIYLVGGDGTLSRALVGLSQNNAPLPVGLFPGGRKNRAFCRIFQPKSQRKEDVLWANLVGKDSVQIFCESAMALIEGEERCVYPVKCTITKETNDSSSDDHEVNAPNTFWLLSDLCAGWFEHCEQRAPKLWWWGPLRYHFVYFWEFLKRKPTPLDLRISYEEFCPGCNRCVVPIKQKNLTSFWSLFTRFLWNSYTDNSNAKPNPDFTLITNPKCGQKREVNVSGADVRLNVEQAEIGSKMRLRVGGGGDSFGRWAAVRFGWHSLAEGKRRGEKTEQSDGHFYVLDIEVDRAELQFTHIPEFVQKLSLAGEWGAFEQYESKKILLETTKEMGEGRTESPLHFYVPKLPMP